MSSKRKKFEVIHNDEMDLARKKKFTEHDILSYQPANPRQSKFINLFHSNTPCIIMDGHPGCGKTFLAVVEALRLVVDQSTHYEKVIYVRSAVTSGEDVGFLPSDMAAKADPYSAPLRDILSQITKYKDPYDNLIALGYLDFRLDTHMRGINLKNCVVIIDEAQCMDYASLKTILTRLDSGSRAVICGDGGQDDLKRKRKKSGWDHLKRVFDNMPYGNYGKVTFTLDDIVRGDGFTKDFIIADFETEKD